MRCKFRPFRRPRTARRLQRARLPAAAG